MGNNVSDTAWPGIFRIVHAAIVRYIYDGSPRVATTRESLMLVMWEELEAGSSFRQVPSLTFNENLR